MGRIRNKTLSFALVCAMLLGMLPAVTLPASAAVIGGGGEKGDLFSELGFDTSKIPEGYLTSSNPYGGPNRSFNEVHEVLLSWRSETDSDGALFFADGLGKTYSNYWMDFRDFVGAAPESTRHEYDAQIEVAGDFFSAGQKEQVVGLGLDFGGNLVMYFKDLSGTMDGSGTVKSSPMGESKVLLAYQEYTYEVSDGGEGTSTQETYRNIGNAYEWEHYFSIHGQRNPDGCSLGRKCLCRNNAFSNTCDGEDCDTLTCDCSPVEYDYSSMLYNYLKLVTGDFTGDGVDEIAVYVPDNQNPRVEIYQFRTGMPGENWWNSGSWYKLHTHYFESLSPDDEPVELTPVSDGTPVTKTLTYAPNAVSLLAGDFDCDGIEDLLLGNAFHTIDQDTPGSREYTASFSLPAGTEYVRATSYSGRDWKENDFNRDEKTDVLFGNQGSPLFSRVLKNITAENQSHSSFFSFGYGDVGYDGEHATGNPNVLFHANEERIYLYFYNRDLSRFLVEDCGPIQYYSTPLRNAQDVTTYYYMTPSRIVLSNALAVNRGVAQPAGLFWQNMIYAYQNGNFNGRAMIPYDGHTTIMGANTESYATAYFGETAVDLDGDGCDEILFYMSQAYLRTLITIPTHEQNLGLDVLYNTDMGPREMGMFKGYPHSTFYPSDLTSRYEFAPDLLSAEDAHKPVFCTPNVDSDTTIIRFKERNFIYTDPEILSVLAAPPVFGDITNLDEGYGSGSETSFGSMTGSGGSSSTTGVLSVGAYFSIEGKVTIPIINVTVAKTTFETSFTSTMSWETETSVTTTYEFEYATSGMQDSVVLYSVPIDVFTYEIVMAPTAEDVKNNAGRPNADEVFVGEVNISIPYSPQIRVIDAEEYDRVAGDYTNILPLLRGGSDGDILTHTPGDPGSYPGSAGQFPGSMQSSGPYNGVAYASQSGSGSISETIAIEHSESQSFSHEHVLEIKAGGGSDNVQAGVTAGGGGGKGASTVNISGTSFSGSVENMPAAAAQYGYGYSWKLLEYQYTSPSDPSVTFPVVTYTVRDVTSPPASPRAVDIDLNSSTNNSLTVNWSYPKGENILGFEVLKNVRGTDSYIPIPDAFISYNKAKEDYSYTDMGLAAGSTYSYKVRTVRLAVPQYSAPSQAVTGRTTSIEQGATVTLSKYYVLVYPDTINEKITAGLSNLVPGAAETLYIWEKWVDGAWSSIGIFDSDIAIVNPTAEDAGLYRLKVSQRLNDIEVVSYSPTLTIEFAKRTSAVTMSVTENQPGQLTVTARVSNQHTNSLSTPGGYVTIHTTDASGTVTSRTLPLSGASGQAGIAQASFLLAAGEGIYSFECEYVGSSVFKGSRSESPALYLMGSTGYTLSISDAYLYGDPVVPAVFEVTNVGGTITNNSIPIFDSSLLSSGADPADALQDGQRYAVINLFGYTESYTYNLAAYPPDTEEGPNPSASEKIHVFIDENDSNGMILDDFTHIMPLSDTGTRYYMTATVYQKAGGQGTVVTSVSKEYTVTKIPVSVEMPTLFKIVSSDEWAIPEKPANWLQSDNELYPNIVYPQGRTGLMPGDSLDDFVSLTVRTHAGQGTSLSNLTSPGTYILDAELKSPNEISPYEFSITDGYIYLNSEMYTTTVLVQESDSGAIPGTASVTSPQGTHLGGGKIGYGYAENLVITAKPNPGWAVEKWIVHTAYQSGGENTVEHPASTTTPNELALGQAYGEVTVTVVFRYNEAVLTFASSDAARGTVSVVNNSFITSGSAVGPGTPIILGAVPKPGYVFSEWSMSVYLTDKSESVENDMHCLSFTMPEANLAVQALFEPEGYTLTLDPNLTASYRFDHDGIPSTPEQTATVGTGASIPYGAVVTVAPAVGYQVAGNWNVSPQPEDLAISPDGQSCTFTLRGSVTVSANTQQSSFQFSWTTAAQNAVTPTFLVNGVATSMNGDYHYSLPGGSNIVMTAPVYSGRYAFDGFDTSGAGDTVCVIDDNTLTIAGLASDVVIGINYRDDNHAYTLIVTPSDLGEIAVTVNGKPVAVPSGGIAVYRGDQLHFTAAANDTQLARYGSWMVNNEVGASAATLEGIAGFDPFEPATGDKITVVNMFSAILSGKSTTSWEFEGIEPGAPGYSISAVTGGGTALTSPASLTRGTKIILSATLADEMVVDHWRIDGAEAHTGSDRLTYVITGDTEIKAVVSSTAPEKVSIVIEQPGNGSITPQFGRSYTGAGTEGNPYLTPEGSELILTVTPDSGYHVSYLQIEDMDGDDVSYTSFRQGDTLIATISSLTTDIIVSATIEQVDNSIGQLKQTILNRSWSVEMSAANTSGAVQAWLDSQITAIGLNGVSLQVTITSFTPAVAGTSANPPGTAGSFSFTATLSKDSAQDMAVVTGGIITPIPYSPVPSVYVTTSSGSVSIGETVTLTATPANISNPQYSWYQNTTNSTQGAAPVGAYSAQYSPSTAVEGTLYYFCTVSGVTSNIVSVTVTDPSDPIGPGGGGGGGSSPAPQTVPAQNGAVEVPFTLSSAGAMLEMPDSVISQMISESGTSGEALIDLSAVSGITAATLPKAAVTALVGAGLDLVISLPDGTITLSEEAAASIAGRATGANLTVALEQIPTDRLTLAQRGAVQQGDLVFDISITSGNFRITSFSGILVVEIPYSGPRPVTVWYLNDRGELQTIPCTDENGVIVFNLNHLSLYLLRSEISTTPWVNPFADVSAGDWFYGDVEFAVEHGLFSGTSATTFSPHTPMTRGMLVTVLGKLANVEPGKYTGSSFQDVSASQYYAPYVKWAMELGIVSGVGSNAFAPDREISRQDLTVILYRYAQAMNIALPQEKGLITFSDEGDMADYAKEAIAAIQQAGIVSGKPGNLFDPGGSATRAEVAAMLHHFVETIQE